MISFSGVVIQQNGHMGPPPIPQAAAVPPLPTVPPPQSWTANQLPSPNISHHSYPASQFGSPTTPTNIPPSLTPIQAQPQPQPNSHWNPTPQPTPPSQGHPGAPQQWGHYASPPPVTAANIATAAAATYYPAPATPTPSYWTPTSQSDQGYAPKPVEVYNQFSPPPNGAATYPTQYPNIPTG